MSTYRRKVHNSLGEMYTTIAKIEKYTTIKKYKGDDEFIKYVITVEGGEEVNVYTTEHSIGRGWDVKLPNDMKLTRCATLFDARESAFFSSEFYKNDPEL